MASSSKLVRFLDKPSDLFSKSKNEEKKAPDSGNVVVCSYLLSLTKIYTIIIVWAKYLLDVYISYIRQFAYMNSITKVPEELAPFYSQMAYEEAKVHCMFRTLMSLEAKYQNAVHLTVVYLTNAYCTLWWIASRITQNIFTRAIVFNVMMSLCNYRSGDLIYHANLIISSYSVSQGACRVCYWVKDVLMKCYQHVSTLMFVEEVLLSVILTLMTTPMCVVLYLLYRIYRTFLLPVMIEESTASYTKLGHGDLLQVVNKLCEKFNFEVAAVYVSQRQYDAHNVKVRGFNDKKYLVLGYQLVEGHNRNEALTIYSKSEIASAVIRAQVDYQHTLPTLDIALEVTRWATLIIFTVFLSLGFFGGSRLGFVPSPPKIISFAISKHLSIPILLVVQMYKNSLVRQRHFNLDEQVADVGFGEHLISYIGKEARLNVRCPVEDPFFTLAYSDRPPIIQRIRSIKTKMATSSG